MKLQTSYILFILLLYPILYAFPYVADNLDYRLSNIYFLLFTVALTVINYYYFPLKFDKGSFYTLLLLTGTSFLILINTNSSEFLKPALFILFLLNVYLIIQRAQHAELKGIIHFFTYLYLAVSFAFLFIAYRINPNDSRFSGFLLSPTVYSVTLEIILILYIYYTNGMLKKVVVYLLVGYLIFLTGTRSNLAFHLMIPVLSQVIRYRHIKNVVFVGIIFFLNFIYLIYEALLHVNLVQKLNSYRYESGQDSSFGLRFYLFKTVLKSFKEDFTFSNFLWGRGSEEARQLVDATMGFDILPHNDFLRFIYDFGVVAALLYILFLYRVSKTSNAAFLLVSLYLVAFYHNMIYTYELPAIALLIGLVMDKDRKEEQLILEQYTHGA